MAEREGLEVEVSPRTRNPRVVRNLLSAGSRYATGSVFGTGVATAGTSANADGVVDGDLVLQAGSAGRAFTSTTLTLGVGWYCLSFEVTSLSSLTAAQNVFTKSSGTSVEESSGFGWTSVTTAQVTAGGVGRYCVVFRVVTAGTFVYRLGVGLAGNEANSAITVQHLCLSKININDGIHCPEFVFPGYSAAFDYELPTSIDSNKKVTDSGVRKYFKIPRYSNIIAVGDSRTDEPDNISGALDNLLADDGSGTCQTHAVGGWATADAVGPTVVGSHTLTIAKALDGTLAKRTFSTAGEEQYYYRTGAPYNTLLVCDFGVNDANGSVAIATTETNLRAILDAAVARDMDLIITDNNPWNAGSTWSSGKQTNTEAVDALLQELAAEYGALFISLRDILKDASDPKKLSDGASTSPDYSADGLHLSTLGSQVAAQWIKDRIYSHVYNRLVVPQIVQATGTVYALTNTAAAIDFGTIDPAITLSTPGTYLIRGKVKLKYNAATVSAETATIKLRRTNNTAADLTISPLSAVAASDTIDLPVATTLTHDYGWVTLEAIYTVTASGGVPNTDDVITLFGNVSAALSAGTIDVVAANIIAQRLY